MKKLLKYLKLKKMEKLSRKLVRENIGAFSSYGMNVKIYFISNPNHICVNEINFDNKMVLPFYIQGELEKSENSQDVDIKSVENIMLCMESMRIIAEANDLDTMQFVEDNIKKLCRFLYIGSLNSNIYIANLQGEDTHKYKTGIIHPVAS